MPYFAFSGYTHDPVLFSAPSLLPCWDADPANPSQAIGPAYIAIDGLANPLELLPNQPFADRPVIFALFDTDVSSEGGVYDVLCFRRHRIRLDDYAWIGIRAYVDLPAAPTTISVSCTRPEPQKRCEQGCIEIVRSTDDAYICICKDTDGPTLAPTQNRISKSTPPERYSPPARPPRTAIQKTRQQYQQRAPELAAAKSNYETAAAKAIDNPTQANLDEANNALWPYGNLQRQQADAEATINAHTTEQERSSGVIVTGGRSINRPTINSPIVVRGTTSGVSINAPTVNTPIKVGPIVRQPKTSGVSVNAPTINAPIVVKPTINRGISLSQTQTKSESVEE